MKRAKGMSKVGTLVVVSAVVCSIAAYVSYVPNAYEIYINDSAVACVKDERTANEVADNILGDIHTRFKDLKSNEEIMYSGVVANSSALSSEKDIKRNVLGALNVRVRAVEMIIDGARAGILADKSEGDKIIGKVSAHYIDNSKLENKQLTGVKNDIKYNEIEVNINQVDEVEDVVEKLLNGNEGNTPFLKVEYTGIKKEKQSVAYSQTVKMSDELSSNASKIVTKGENGEKEVESCISFINNETKSSNVISEKVIKAPQNEVVLKGKEDYSPSAVSMLVPSRGSVSSNFGMRWGKMHEGIDIAAKIGEPIYAAMDGKVIYSGWIEGYGYAVKLQHDDNLQTLYGHCSKLIVKMGDSVEKGQLIANVGSTGNSTGPHVHFEVRIDGKAVNPYPYIYKK